MALAGFDLVRDFGDAAAEARACRSDCALFDFSFLECARVAGIEARRVIETFTGRSLDALGEGEIFYALRADPSGALAADLTVWRTGADSFEVMSGRREDIIDLMAWAAPCVDVTDLTAQRAVFAVQGPRTLEALRKLGDVSRIESLKYFAFGRAQLAGIPCTIGRLGYTGEAGVEIIADRILARELWQALCAQVRPAGFIAADMLRIEAGFVLFSNEFCIPVSPREAGLEKFCRPTVSPKPEISLVSFRAEADNLTYPWQPPRDLQRPTAPGSIAVTSACHSIAAGGILGLAYVLGGTAPDCVLRDATRTFHNIRLVSKPFYDAAKRRPRAPWR